MIGNQLPEVTGRRKSPVALSYPSDMDYTIRVISKTGLNIRRDSYFADEQSFLFGSSASVRGDTLLLNYQFRFHSHEVAPENVAEFAAHMKQIKNDRLSYGLSFHPGGMGSLNNYSWWAFVYSVLLIALFSFLAVRVYHKKPRWHPADTGQPLKVYSGIGGWLILLMISFALSPFAYLFGLLTSNFYHAATWQAYDQQGVGQAILFRGVIFFELSANLFMLVLASFCFLLLAQQKRLFPQVAILYFVSNMMVVIIDFSLLPTVDINPFDDPENIRGLLGATIGAAIWVPYMMHSKRVRGTFVRP